jgi:hypothetical protein
VSPWKSQTIFSKKREDASKEEKWQLVVDFLPLNEKTEGGSYPLPLISDILGALVKGRYYTTVDLASQYCAGGKIEKNEMGGACGAYGRGERRVQGYGGET